MSGKPRLSSVHATVRGLAAERRSPKDGSGFPRADNALDNISYWDFSANARDRRRILLRAKRIRSLLIRAE